MTVRRVIVFFFYYANARRTLLRADIAGLCGRVRISLYDDVSSTVISGAAYQGVYDCITILGWLSNGLLRAMYTFIWWLITV